MQYHYTAAPVALAFNETELPGAERDREVGTLYVDGFGYGHSTCDCGG